MYLVSRCLEAVLVSKGQLDHVTVAGNIATPDTGWESGSYAYAASRATFSGPRRNAKGF